MPQTSLRYPENLPAHEGYDVLDAATGSQFMRLLFDYDHLDRVTNPNFYGHEGAGMPTLVGRQALVAYRKGLSNASGDPRLLEANMLAVPASQAPEIPRTGKPANFSTITEFIFNLPPDQPQFPTRVRMWESLDIRNDPEGPHGRKVFGRIWRPLGAVGLLEDSNQHDFVGRQVQHFLDRGTPLPVLPIEEVYAILFPGYRFSPK